MYIEFRAKSISKYLRDLFRLIMGDDILLRRPHLHYLSAENIYQFNDIEIKSIGNVQL